MNPLNREEMDEMTEKLKRILGVNPTGMELHLLLKLLVEKYETLEGEPNE